MRRDELLEWSIDLEEENIGDEAIDAGVDTGRPRPVQIAAAGDEVCQYPQIRDPARVATALKWNLWHGQVERAICELEKIIADMDKLGR